MNPEKNPMADTAELPILDGTASASAGSGRVRVDCAGLSHQGRVRTKNEDHFLVVRFGRFLTPLCTNMPNQSVAMFEEEGHAMVIADGMGGAPGGELASSLAIRTLVNLTIQTPDWILSSEEADANRVMERMAERYRRVDERLVEEGTKNAQVKGMGTTMTLACNFADCLVLTHIGDTRAYLYRAGVLHQLTRDHTLAQELVNHGFVKRTADAARQLQHSLVRVLGGIGHQCEADVQRLMLLDKDLILLCSDGLTNMVKDADISAILAEGRPAADACTALVERALKNGGKDNVTVVAARYAFISRPAS
jgi:serine/threonine protein phosphatase PrpC